MVVKGGSLQQDQVALTMVVVKDTGPGLVSGGGERKRVRVGDRLESLKINSSTNNIHTTFTPLD